MSIATEKVKRASERFMLVRLTPARYVGGDLMLSSGIYEMAFSHPIARIERNGTALTEVQTAPSSNDEWQHDESTGTLQIKLASAPSETSNVIVVFYHLFYTSGDGLAWHEDPEDTSTPKRLWEPRILRAPTVRQSIRNIINGVFSIDDGTLQLANTDDALQAHLVPDTSFRNKEIRIWLCINSPEHIEPLYVGRCRDASTNRGTASIRFYDEFSKLSQPALMGDSRLQAYYLAESGSFPNVDPRKTGTPIRYFVGPSSRVTWAAPYQNISGINSYHENLDSLYEAVCLSYSMSSTSSNREWGIGRFKAGIATQDFGTIQAIYHYLGGVHFLRLSGHSNIQVGDTLRVTVSGVTRYYEIWSTETFTYSGNTYNVLVWPVADTADFSSGTLVPSPSISINAKMASTSPRKLLYGRDYTLSSFTTGGGNTFYSIIMANNWEGNSFGLSAPIDPTTDQVLFRVRASGVHGHADVLKAICEAAGIDVDPDSFDAAAADLDTDCQFSMPYYDETDFKSYLDYAQDICKSVAGYLSINSDMQARYTLLAAPDTGGEIDDHLELGEFDASVDYKDIATQIIAFNPHLQTSDAIVDTNGPSLTRGSAKAQYLHDLINVDRFRHVLTQIGDRIDVIMALRATALTTYRYKVATEDLDSSIGDDKTLAVTGLLSGAASANVKIIALDKGVDAVSVTATPLEGL